MRRMYKVLFKNGKYRFTSEVKKAGLLTVFVLFTGLLYAQGDDQPFEAPDSAIVTQEEQEESNYGSGTGTSSGSDYSEKYFDQKWEHEGSWDSLYGRKL